MKTMWSLSLLCLLWGAAPAWADTGHGVASGPGDPEAPLTMTMVIESLPPDCVGTTCTLDFVIVLRMTDGQALTVDLRQQRYPRVAGEATGKFMIRHWMNSTFPWWGVRGTGVSWEPIGRLAQDTPMRIRAAARGERRACSSPGEGAGWYGRSPSPRLAEVQVGFSGGPRALPPDPLPRAAARRPADGDRSLYLPVTWWWARSRPPTTSSLTIPY